MPCPNCGGHMHGNGVTEPYHCERIERPDGVEPDADPVYCTQQRETTMEHKLVYCGKCGLDAVTEMSGHFLDDSPDREVARCPTGRHSECLPEHWNAAQFAARTERINAAAVAMWAKFKPQNAPSDDKIISWAGDLISAQDAAARARWAEMQKGE